MWLTGRCEVSAAGQGPGELVRPVPKARQAVRSPAHSVHPALQSSAGPTAPRAAAATGIPGQAQQDLCTGRTPAKPAHEASATPRHDAPGAQPLAVLAHGTHCGRVLLQVHRGQTAAPLCPQTNSQESRWFGWRAGKQCQGLPWLPPGAEAQRPPDLHPHPARPQCWQTLPCGSAGR